MSIVTYGLGANSGTTAHTYGYGFSTILIGFDGICADVIAESLSVFSRQDSLNTEKVVSAINALATLSSLQSSKLLSSLNQTVIESSLQSTLETDAATADAVSETSVVTKSSAVNQASRIDSSNSLSKSTNSLTQDSEVEGCQ